MSEEREGAGLAPTERWLAWAISVVFLGTFLWMIKALALAVVLGALFALVLDPLRARLAKRLGRFGSFAPLAVTLAAVFLVVGPLVYGLIRALGAGKRFLKGDWSTMLHETQAFLADKLDSPRIQGLRDQLGLSGDDLRSKIEHLVATAGGTIAEGAQGFAAALPRSVLQAFIFILALFYFLRDGAKLAAWAERVSPFSPEDTEELFASVRGTVGGAVSGLFAVAAVQGVLTTLALAIFRVPGWFLFGILATLLSFIPMVGTAPVTLGACLYLLASGRTGSAIGMLVAAGLIALADNVIRPWVQSKSSDMHPLVALLGLFGGLQLFGVSGIFLGPIVAAMGLWTVDSYAAIRTKQRRRSLLLTEGLPPSAPRSKAGAPTSGDAPPTARAPTGEVSSSEKSADVDG